MSTWQELKPQLINALVNAFDEHEFERVLEFECTHGGLNVLSPRDRRYPDRVRDVVNDAVRREWLEELMRGARKQNNGNSALRDVVEAIQIGIGEHGEGFYPAINHEISPEVSSAASHQNTINIGGNNTGAAMIGNQNKVVITQVLPPVQD